MIIKVTNRDTNERVSKFDDAKTIYTDDLFSFTIIDHNGQSHWYNASLFDYEVIDES